MTKKVAFDNYDNAGASIKALGEIIGALNVDPPNAKRILGMLDSWMKEFSGNGYPQEKWVSQAQNRFRDAVENPMDDEHLEEEIIWARGSANRQFGDKLGGLLATVSRVARSWPESLDSDLVQELVKM